ncbi:MAG: hypothetical protein LBK75_09085 [Oscillospiraceae bacterium]|nr:hypothetical protein [Oscillospiraceae bacterium]
MLQMNRLLETSIPHYIQKATTDYSRSDKTVGHEELHSLAQGLLEFFLAELGRHIEAGQIRRIPELLPGADTWNDPKHGAVIEKAADKASLKIKSIQKTLKTL